MNAPEKERHGEMWRQVTCRVTFTQISFFGDHPLQRITGAQKSIYACSRLKITKLRHQKTPAMYNSV